MIRKMGCKITYLPKIYNMTSLHRKGILEGGLFIEIGNIWPFNGFDKESSVVWMKQTWENKEIIVIDDNSTDNSYKLIKESKYKDQILLIRNNKNRGPGYSRNKILELAQGDFVCFMYDVGAQTWSSI